MNATQKPTFYPAPKILSIKDTLNEPIGSCESLHRVREREGQGLKESLDKESRRKWEVIQCKCDNAKVTRTVLFSSLEH